MTPAPLWCVFALAIGFAVILTCMCCQATAGLP